jgi:hypothetical protein
MRERRGPAQAVAMSRKPGEASPPRLTGREEARLEVGDEQGGGETGTGARGRGRRGGRARVRAVQGSRSARSTARRPCAGECPPVPRSRMRRARPLPVPMMPGNTGPGSVVMEEGYRGAGGGSGCAWGAAARSGQGTTARKRQRPWERRAQVAARRAGARLGNRGRRVGLGRGAWGEGARGPGGATGWGRRLEGGGWRGEEKTIVALVPC